MKNSYQAEPAAKILSEEIVNNELATDKHISQQPRANRFIILLSLLALYLIWGSTYLGMRIALVGFPPFLMAGIRFLLAGSILFVIMRARGMHAPTRKQWIGAALIGTLLLVGGNGGVAFSEQWVSTGLASVGIAAVPLWTALFAGLWGRWPTRVEWFGLGLGFMGVLLLNLGNGIWANPLGAIALLLAAICWALGSAWSLHISLPSGLMSSAAQMLVGGAVLILLSLALRERTPNLAVSQSLWAIAYLVVFGSLLAFSAYGYLLRHVSPALATSYAYVNPMVAVGLGVLLAGEHLSAIEIVAILVTLTGVGLVSLGSSRGGRNVKSVPIKQENLAASE
ncbi:MAG: drug/metabolite exporter YedA [Chloroflexi bacterium]|nr:MAG: drug/metabolite exporter YedA [Chloroflexota bacterium]